MSAIILEEMQSDIPPGHLLRCCVVDQSSDRLISPAKPSVIGADVFSAAETVVLLFEVIVDAAVLLAETVALTDEAVVLPIIVAQALTLSSGVSSVIMIS